MRLHKRSTKCLYCLCQHCTAKWFCRRLAACCPRCGSHDFITTLARMPWESHSLSEAEVQRSNEQVGNEKPSLQTSNTATRQPASCPIVA